MEPGPFWEDRSVKFDVTNLINELRGGEKILNVVEYVEDSKGNPGDVGKLLCTNLRIIWYSLHHKNVNLTIGYARIISIRTRTVLSKLRGTTQALYILAAGVNMKFEFLFTDLALKTNKDTIFSAALEIFKIYQQSFLYRELKLRGAIVHLGNLLVLDQEQVFNKVSGVWNLSSDQGNLGTFIITNVRLVWFADVNETFNISLPYIQISNIKIRESKYGPALVVQTMDTAGGYVLGFRIDPSDRLVDMYKELTSLYSIYSKSPNFGVNYEAKLCQTCADGSGAHCAADIENSTETNEKQITSKFNSYLAEGFNTSGPRKPFYCKELGFAMEKIRDGYKLNDLWEVSGTRHT